MISGDGMKTTAEKQVGFLIKALYLLVFLAVLVFLFAKAPGTGSFFTSSNQSQQYTVTFNR